MSEVEKAQEEVSKTTTSTSDEDLDDAVEPKLTCRHTSLRDIEDEESDDSIMPMPATLSRAQSAPIEGEKSPFQRRKRRQDRKSLRQQNPNHPLHSLLPEDMKETPETEEASALARAREKRKLLLAKRNSQQEEEDNDQQKGLLTPASATSSTFAQDGEEETPSNAHRTSSYKNQYSSCSSDGSAVKNPINLDKFFAMEQAQREQDRIRRLTKQQQSLKDLLPPTPPSSPLKFATIIAPTDVSIAEESLLPYSYNNDDADYDDTSMTSNNLMSGDNAALLQTYQEKLAKQLLELQDLCDQDNDIQYDEHSTFTNPDHNTPRHSTLTNPDNTPRTEKEDDDDSSSSDSSGNLLMTQQIPADLRLTGRSVHVVQEDEDESEPSEDEQDFVVRRPSDGSSQSDRLSGSSKQVVLEEEEEEEEPLIANGAAPTFQAMHRDIEQDTNALAGMKTPIKSNRSPKSHDDEEEDLEDLYRTDKWGNADTKEEIIVDDDGHHVSTTTKVVVATVAVVAGFCMRTFGRHR